MEDVRKKLEAFRVSPHERRELGLLAKARGTTKSHLLRALVREAAERETGDSYADAPPRDDDRARRAFDTGR